MIESILTLIEEISLGLYTFVVLLLLWNLRRFVTAHGEIRVAQFALERELAQRQGGLALTQMIVSFEIFVLIWALVNITLPTWVGGLPDQSSQLGQVEFATSTPAQSIEFRPFTTAIPGQSGITEIIATAPPPSTPKGTIFPAEDRVGCTIEQAWIDYPDNGMAVFGPIVVEGTANISDFAFYRFEIKKSNADSNFSPLGSDYTQPVINGPLGQFVPTNIIEGGYRFRLVVFDTSAQPVASCEITVFVVTPVPTETPFGS